MKFRHFATAVVTASFFATAAYAAGEIEKRQDLMETVGDQVKIVGPMLQGKVAFDAAKAKAASETIAANAADFPNHFPAGTETGGDTEALPVVWTQFEDFKAKSQKLADDAKLAAAAADQGEDAFKAAAGAMMSNCKSCHEVYRKPS